MFKKILKAILSLSIFIMAVPIVNTSATSEMSETDIIDAELEKAIISGDGTGDNPYVVDYDKAPHFKAYMDTINDKVMYALQGGNQGGIQPFGIYDGILIGTKHTGQTRGGYWKYGSGAPTSAVNGNIWMKSVTYTSISDTKLVYNLLKDDYKWSRIEEIASSIASKPYDEVYSLIVSSGIAGSTATALLRGIGKISSVFTAVTILQFINKYFVLSRYSSAVNNGDGMIHAVYNTSYQGQWYSHEGEDTWTTANTAYEPATVYGKGTYKSY